MGDIKPKPAQYFINLMEKILEEKRKNQTNEKWFCKLPTEEKAKVIVDLGRKQRFSKDIEIKICKQWLKEVHKE